MSILQEKNIREYKERKVRKALVFITPSVPFARKAENNNDTHEIEGTDFNQYCEYKKEPYQNYLARNLSPSINFAFDEDVIDGNRVVMLTIPAAEDIPTAFNTERYIRIGSSKVNLKDYPKREIELFKILSGMVETIETLPAKIIRASNLDGNSAHFYNNFLLGKTFQGKDPDACIAAAG